MTIYRKNTLADTVLGTPLLSKYRFFFVAWIPQDSVRFLWDSSCPCWHDCITHLHSHAVRLLLFHILNVFYWFQIQSLGRTLKDNELTIWLPNLVWDNFCFGTWCNTMLDVAIWRWVKSGNARMHKVSNNALTDCGIQAMMDGPKKPSPTPLHQFHHTELLTKGRLSPKIQAKLWPLHLYVLAEIEIQLPRVRFSSLQRSSFGVTLPTANKIYSQHLRIYNATYMLQGCDKTTSVRSIFETYILGFSWHYFLSKK